MGFRLWTCSLSHIIPLQRRWRARKDDASDDEQTASVSPSTIHPASDSPPTLPPTWVSLDSLQWSTDTEFLLDESCASSASTAPTSPAPSVVLSTATDADALAVPDPMGPATVRRVVASLARVFGPCAFAVHGLAAMAFHGFDERRPDRIGAYCSKSAVPSVRAWARENGLRVLHGNPNSFAIRLSGERAKRPIRILYLEDEDAQLLETIPAVEGDGESRARVLSLRTLANAAARAYMDCPAGWAGVREAHLEDVRWLMRRCVETEPRGRRFTRRSAPYVVDRAFWRPFTERYPEDGEMLREAGFYDEEPEQGSEWRLGEAW